MKMKLYLMLIWVVFGALGCASNEAARAGLDDTLSNHTRALAVLETRSEYAKRAQADLLTVHMNLSRAERAYGDENPDYERAELLLKATAAELAEIQTRYTRWDEEQRLEELRLDYAGKMEGIEAARQENDAVLNSAGGNP